MHLVADLTGGDGEAHVRIEYVLTGTSAEAAVGATALEFAGARMQDVRVERDGPPLRVERPRPLAGLVRLPVSSRSGSNESVVATWYDVSGAVVERGALVRGHIPVLSVDLPPEGASPGLFRAQVRLPPGWVLTEGFPTGLAATDTPGVYAADLAVVPAVLSFRARSDGRWRPGLPALLDAAAVMLVAAFSVVGWRHLRDAP